MGYQENCEAYALYGNPERDHWDHEEAARYDRFDGYREEFHDEWDDLPCPDCSDETKCPACQKAVEEMKAREAEAKAEKARRAAEADDPTSPHYCPF